MKSKIDNPMIQIMKTRIATIRAAYRLESLEDRVIILCNENEYCIRTLLALRYFKIGNLVLRQVCGIPIRGSSIRYDSWVCTWPPRAPIRYFRLEEIPQKWKGRSEDRRRWLSLPRYVDDVLAISDRLCLACVTEVRESIYG